MKFIAHRGESKIAPENTMASFKLAWEYDAVGIEGDFYALTDGRVACMHDQNAKRTTGVDVDITTIDYAKLRELDAGSWKAPEWRGEKVPLLDDIFAGLPTSCQIYVEVKDASNKIVERINDLAAKYKIRNSQIVIISFTAEAVKRASEVMPDCKRLLLTGLEYSPENGFTPSVNDLLASLRDIHADGVDCYCHPELTREYIKQVQDAGFEFHVWTVNDVVKAQRMIDFGVDSITTDCANELRKYFAK